MPYFRTGPGDPHDLLLLPKGQREHEDLVGIATRAERAVINHFTKRRQHDDAYGLDVGVTSLERYVWLRGYKPDPAEANAAFAEAIRDSIALVIRWKIAQDEKRPNVAADGGKDTSREYRPDAEEALPAGFDKPLRAFILDGSPIYI